MPISRSGRVLRPSFDGHLDQLADAFLIEDGERIGLEDLQRSRSPSRTSYSRRATGPCVVCVRSLVPKLKNSASLATWSAVSAARGISIMVPTMYCRSFMPALPSTSSATRYHDLLLVLQFLHAADQRNHDFGNHLDALLGHLHGGFEDGARLHLGDLGIGDAETAAAMAEHRVELVQLFDALQQLGQLLLQVAHRDAVLRRHFLLRLCSRRSGSRARSTIRSSRLGRNSCSGGSSVRITTGKPSIALNRPAKSLRCMGSSFCERLAAGLLVARQNHRLHVRDAILGEEHVLGAAQADAFGAELAGGFGVARNIRIGAHAEACRGTRRPTP